LDTQPLSLDRLEASINGEENAIPLCAYVPDNEQRT
jgi:hypothetical protein